MFNKLYVYHVVYAFRSVKGSGQGTITIESKGKIQTTEDIKNIAKYIEENHGMGSVTITSWKRMKS